VTAWGSALRAAGLKVVDNPVPGRPYAFTPKGIMLHHTAGKYPTDLRIVTNGVGAVEGPASQLYLAPDGTWHVVSIGRANHAGVGRFSSPQLDVPTNKGNQYLIGLEVSSLGTSDIGGKQYAAMVRGVAALLLLYGWTHAQVIRHRDYTTRKIDILNDLNKVRADIRREMEMLRTPPFPLEPGHYFGRDASSSVHDGTASPQDRAAVQQIQRWLKIKPTGKYGPYTALKVARFQFRVFGKFNWKVGRATWVALSKLG
jgi:peptidoglycan hydrolase-like protein with peptidoglycan-binding domain